MEESAVAYVQGWARGGCDGKQRGEAYYCQKSPQNTPTEDDDAPELNHGEKAFKMTGHDAVKVVLDVVLVGAIERVRAHNEHFVDIVAVGVPPSERARAVILAQNLPVVVVIVNGRLVGIGVYLFYPPARGWAGFVK